MSDLINDGAVRPLPEKANLEHLKNQAKQLLKQMRVDDAKTKLTEAQFSLAKSYGFSSWRELKQEVDQRQAVLASSGDDQNRAEIIRALVHAVEQGDLVAVMKAVESEPDWLNFREGNWEQTLLHKAAWRNQPEVAAYLIKAGADVNARCKGDHAVPLHFAAEQGNLETVKLLVEAGSDVIGEGDLHELGIIGWACCFGGYQPHVVEYLLQQGGRHHLFSAVACNEVKTLEQLLKDDPSGINRQLSEHDGHKTLLHIAVRRQSEEAAQCLLDHGADANVKDDQGYTPLAMAAQGGYSSLVEMLRPHTDEMDPSSMLWLAPREEALKMLAEQPEWSRPCGLLDRMLAGACYGDSLEKIQHLVSLGARADACGDLVEWAEDVTPLHMAASNNRRDLCEYLIELGADPGLKDGSYDSASWGWAYHFGHKALGDWLKSVAEDSPLEA